MKKLLFVVLLLSACSVQLLAQMKTSRISVATDFSRNGDSLTVRVSRYTGRLDEIARNFKAVFKAGKFGLAIPAHEYAQYIQIQFFRPEQKILEQVLLFPGDDMAVSVKNGKISFTGRSAMRFIAQQNLQAIADRSLRRDRLRFTPATLPRIFAHTDSAAIASLEYLDKIKEQIGPTAWRLLGDNVKASAACTKLGYFNYAGMNRAEDVQENFKSAMLQYGKPFNSFTSFSAANDSGIVLSNYSIEYIYQKYLADSCVFRHKKFNIHEFYLYTLTNFKGEIREQLMTHLFITKRNSPEFNVADIIGALAYVKDNNLHSVLDKIRATNTVGAIAPTFTLLDKNNRPINLIDFRGKLIMLDFWFTGCGACKDMAPRMLYLEKKYAEKPIVFITICVDRKREQWLATLNTNEYTSPLSVNLYTEGKGQTHSVMRDFDVRGFPTFILIDKEGRFCPKPVLEVEEMSRLIDRYL